VAEADRLPASRRQGLLASLLETTARQGQVLSRLERLAEPARAPATVGADPAAGADPAVGADPAAGADPGDPSAPPGTDEAGPPEGAEAVGSAAPEPA
jgi:hypothetical protein